jgi:hypothetical protein
MLLICVCASSSVCQRVISCAYDTMEAKRRIAAQLAKIKPISPAKPSAAPNV